MTMLHVLLALFVLGLAVWTSDAQVVGQQPAVQGAAGQQSQRGWATSVPQAGAAEETLPAPSSQETVLPPHNLLTDVGKADKAQADANAGPGGTAPATTRTPATEQFYAPGTNPV